MEVRDLQRDDIPALKSSGLNVDAILQPLHRAHVAVDPQIVGLAVWRATPHPQPAFLKTLIVTDQAPDDTIHLLALHTATVAKQEGYKRAFFNITSRALLDRLVALYGIQPLPLALSTTNGEPTSWRHTVDLDSAIAILLSHLPVPTS